MSTYKNSLIAAMSVFLILDTVAVAARVYVRTVLIRAFGWDDAALCLAFFGYVMACTMGFISIHYGYAAEGEDAHRPYYDKGKTETFYFANQLTLYLASGVVKLAVALVLYRLAITLKLRIILVISMILVSIWTFVTTLFSSWLCGRASTGVSDYVGSHTCTEVGLFRMISNIFIDYFFAFLPIPMLWHARMSIRMKMSVCALLGLGMFASSATIAKLVILVKMEHSSGIAADHLHYELLIWAVVELALAIFCASAAALRPLLRRFSSIWGSENTKGSGNTQGGSTGASASCQALSHNDRGHDQSNAGSTSSRHAGILEYELHMLDSDKTEQSQEQHAMQLNRFPQQKHNSPV